MKYLVAQEIKSETKVGKQIYLFDFYFLIIYMSVSLVLGNAVHSSLQVPFYIYSLLMALILTSKSYYNKKRRNYASIALMFQKDLQVYETALNVSRQKEREAEQEDLFEMRLEEKREPDKREKKGKLKKSVADLLPVVGYDQDAGCYRLKNGKVLDLIQINSKDLVNSSGDEVEYDCMKFAKLYKMYENDLKLVVLNFPCNTVVQQGYLQRKLEKTSNPIYQRFLQRKVDELVWLDKHNTTREFYYMLFAKDPIELDKLRGVIKTVLHTGKDGLLIEMSDEKKHQVFYRLNNKNSMAV